MIAKMSDENKQAMEDWEEQARLEEIATDRFILDHVLNDATTDESVPYVIFGINDFVEMAGKRYDFLFHGIPNVDFDILEEHPFFNIIPVFTPQESAQTRLAMYELYKNKPYLRNFSLRSKTTRVATDKKDLQRIVPGTFLDFYHVENVPVGTRIVKDSSPYEFASEADCREHFSNWDRIFSNIQQSRRELDEKYSSHAA